MHVTTIRTNWADSELNVNTHIITFNNKCIIVDAGASLEDVLDVVGDKPVLAILITHAHYDHITHLENYESYFGCPIIMHENSRLFLSNPELNVSKYFGAERVFKLGKVDYIKGKETLTINDLDIKTIYTPGHTDDSVCYLFSDGTLFSGDTVFARAVGRTDLATGNPKRLIVSLNQILKLDFNEMYTGHLRSSNKEEQLKNIPVWIKYLKTMVIPKKD